MVGALDRAVEAGWCERVRRGGACETALVEIFAGLERLLLSDTTQAACRELVTAPSVVETSPPGRANDEGRV